MKQIMQKLKNHFGGVNFLILMIYTAFVMVAQVFHNPQRSAAFSVVTGLAVLLVMAVLGPVLLRFLATRNAYPQEPKKTSVLKRVLVNGCFYFIPLAVFLFYFIACFPGGWSDDSFNQYTQAIQNQYNDWHPVLHTLLAFKLPLTLTGGWIGSVVLLQVLCYSGAMGYACNVIKKHFGMIWALVAMVWMVLNPLVMMTSMHPWKDVGFAICALLLAAYALQAVATKGQWLHRWQNLICFGLVAVAASIFRHNGILFVAPVVLAMALFLSWKRALTLCLGVVLLFAVVKGPVYGLVGSEKPAQRQVETLGLPMTVIGAVASRNPAALDAETREFVYRVSSKEVWEEKYILGDYNAIKYDDLTNNDVIEEYGRGKVISMMIRTTVSDPKNALSGLVALTKQLFGFSGAAMEYALPRVVGQHDVIKQTPNLSMMKVLKTYSQAVNKFLSHTFLHLGIQHFILLAFVLAKVKLKKRLDLSKLLVVLGVFCYNFGSGLLLTSYGDIYRFFFYTFPLMPVLLLMLCCNHDERSKPLFAWFKK